MLEVRKIKKYLYSKKGQVLSSIARDCLIKDVGEKLPTIKEYTTAFCASRGIIQESIKHLQDIGGIVVKTGGVKGTIITQINKQALIPYTGWRAITVSLPLPLNPLFVSLTTALNLGFKNFPLATAFAHTSGSENRLELLLTQAFDIIIVSQKSAEVFLESTSLLNPPVVLETAGYSYPFYLYSKNKDGIIKNGMTTLIDPASTDQAELTKKVFRNKKVDLIEIPYVTFFEPQNFQSADIVICRSETYINNQKGNRYYQHDLSKYIDYKSEGFLKPVLLTNQENYGINQLVKKYFDGKAIGEIQRKVLLGELGPIL